MYGLVDPKITAFKVHMYIQISCTPSSLHTLIHSHPHIPFPHSSYYTSPPHILIPSHPFPLTSSHLIPSHPYPLTSSHLIPSHPHIIIPSHPYPLTSSHPHPLTPSSPYPLTSLSPHTLTLWVVGDWQGQHDSLGEKCRVTLVTRVQGQPYLCKLRERANV